MSGQEQEFRIVLLEDAPAPQDAFGPHKRVAEAISDLIKSDEPGGKAIGLEGNWGSGKSTVVGFVREALEHDKRYSIINFDAWAHQGDPLRRTYLEAVIEVLQKENWIKDKTADETKEVLANRRKQTTTRNKSRPTGFGVALGAALLLVPIGTTLLSNGLQRSFRGMWTGGILTLAPVIVMGIQMIRIWKSRRKDASNSIDWAFLLNKTLEITETDTVETPNPTSIEFENHFNTILREALADTPQRRLLLVLDNIDRVDSVTAIAIWSTLQTFLQERRETWFKQVWILVPYDPRGLQKIWGPVGSGDASESFIDKSFQIRFQVSPPVLSDWKSYLISLINIALPDHSSEDKYSIYQAYEQWLSESEYASPTPRELKLCINQVGAILRQWKNSFPPGHVAYYALQTRNKESVIQRLRASTLPGTGSVRQLGDGLLENLAGLAFNVPPKKGMELLLSDPIYKNLTEGQADKLVAQETDYADGFWTVFANVVSLRIHGAPTHLIAQAAECLVESKLLSEATRPEVKTIIRNIGQAARFVQVWSPFNKKIAQGLVALCRIQNNLSFSEAVGNSLAASLASPNYLGPTNDAMEATQDILLFISGLKDLGHTEAIPKRIIIPVDPEGWMAVCAALSKDEAARSLYSHFLPSEKPETITERLSAIITEGEFKEIHGATIVVSLSSPIAIGWDQIITALGSRLGSQGIGAKRPAEAYSLLMILDLLRIYGKTEADTQIRNLFAKGYILHHLSSSASIPEFHALCLLIQLQGRHTIESMSATVGQSAAGRTVLSDALASADPTLAANMVKRLTSEKRLAFLLEYSQARELIDPLIAACLRIVSKSDLAYDLFNGPTLLNRWKEFVDALREEDGTQGFYSLLEKLSQRQAFFDAIQNSENGFSSSDSQLYVHIVNNSHTPNAGFLEWCRHGLESMTQEEWTSDFANEFYGLELAMAMAENSTVPNLTTPFSDALVTHAELLIQGQGMPRQPILGQWSKILGFVPQEISRSIIDRILSACIVSNGEAQGPIFQLYGDRLADEQILAANGHSILRLFSPILRQRNIEGLRWVNALVQAHPNILARMPSSDNPGEFRTRLKDCIAAPEGDEAQAFINSLAQTLEIEVRPNNE